MLFLFIGDNPFEPCAIPGSSKDLGVIYNLSAANASIFGPIPEFMGKSPLPQLCERNSLSGHIPLSLASIPSLHLQDQRGTELDLHGNQFTRPIPNLTANTYLRYLDLSHNRLTGTVPESLAQLQFLQGAPE